MSSDQALATGFQEILLEDVCSVKSSKRIFANEYVSSGIPFFRSKDVIDKCLGVFERCDLYISRERFNELKVASGYPINGDILLSAVGNRCGKAYVVKNDGDFYFKDGNIIWISEFGDINSSYLCLFLNSRVGQSVLESVMIGSAQKALTIEAIKNLRIQFPTIRNQKAIAHILGTLDDKIELNRKTNKTLEAMAKALFKSWFVDFDPVRAKAEGRPTGLPAEISDLFPDSFEDSELGEIPSGWKISNLGSLIKQCGEPIQASSTTMELPYVPIDCISNKSLALREYKSGAEANTSLLLFREGDLLFGAMRPYFHKVCIAPFDGTTRTTCFALRPFTDSHYAFAAMLLSATSTIEYATLHSTGSTIPYIRWSNGLENMLLIQPPDPVLDCFNKTALPILRKISISLFTEKPIAAVRDILLPKLISGEIRIPDAEKMLEEVGI